MNYWHIETEKDLTIFQKTSEKFVLARERIILVVFLDKLFLYSTCFMKYVEMKIMY
ncbi:hypothetical protein U27_01683 [Candidatus Vecturithrix granuli]|uniref:Uncharacterized protein n=1 Tax=Vecturithrix granuli TaxID=1499967 RepID=A0A0S6W968_VECG1|nr:hypothetical protein U27_01683 [Candidatus Vecturithrix granuli]